MPKKVEKQVSESSGGGVPAPGTLFPGIEPTAKREPENFEILEPLARELFVRLVTGQFRNSRTADHFAGLAFSDARAYLVELEKQKTL